MDLSGNTTETHRGDNSPAPAWRRTLHRRTFSMCGGVVVGSGSGQMLS